MCVVLKGEADAVRTLVLADELFCAGEGANVFACFCEVGADAVGFAGCVLVELVHGLSLG